MSIKQEKTPPIDGLKTFYELEELKAFGNTLIKYYESKVEHYNQRLGTMLRHQGNSKEEANKLQPTLSKGWVKVGSILVNLSNPSQATTEVLFRLLEDSRAKLAAVKTFMDSLDNILNIGVKKESAYLLCVRNGVPERIIVEEYKRGKGFNYSVKLQAASD